MPRQPRIRDRLPSSSAAASRQRRKNNFFAPRTFFAVVIFAASLLLAWSLYLSTRSDRQPLLASASLDVVPVDNIIRPVVCHKLLKDPNIWDPNEGLNKDDLKRFTITDPPFWISLHSQWFDKMRWVSIKDRGEYYEKGVTSVFHDILTNYDLKKEKNTPLVLDIGMNIGWFSLYSRAHGHDVAAFEPNPIMFLRMCESLGYNEWDSHHDDHSVSLWQYGLGVQQGVFNLATGNNPGGSSFFEDRLAKKFRKTMPVHVTTLDSVAAKQGWFDRKISLMKVDVEGFEPYVFEGGKRLLSEGRVENIFMENSVTNATKVGEMVDFLYSTGFRIKGIYTVNGEPYHKEWWPTFNPDLGLRQRGVVEPSDQIKFLAKVTCNIWWINSKFSRHNA